MLVLEKERLSKTDDPLADIVWERRDIELRDSKGNVVFHQADVECPADWSPLACKIAVEKYFSGQLGEPNRETSIRHMIERVSETITKWGENQRYFTALSEDAQIFQADLQHILINQMAAFNSPVWFNVGVHEKPQCSACFISSVEDSMESIEKLYVTEMETFKNGSGNGTNFSKIRGSNEPLARGGKASGPIPFMKGLDFSCGAMKSGGKARRGAKMVILNVDHPDILEFIELKKGAEKMALDLIAAGHDDDWDTGVYKNIPWQNANNSVRVTDSFMTAVENDENWDLTSRVGGRVVATHRARDLFSKIASAAWTNGCPGIQFHDTINAMHTCTADGEIEASNPCSEYMFLNETSCNLASINLIKFLGRGGFDWERFQKVVRIMIIAQDILIDNAGYPNAEIEETSRKYRTLGLGYSNLGALLMTYGLAYDSDAGRHLAAAITTVMQATAYHQSHLIASQLGGFERYEVNEGSVKYVIGQHFQATARMGRQEADSFPLEETLTLYQEAMRGPIRNAQVTVLAPCGTIGFLLDCDTTGVEPELALVKTKKMVGGTVERIVNTAVRDALVRLGYAHNIDNILEYIERHETVVGSEIRPEHYHIFDTSLSHIKDRVIRWKGHVLMMAAVQPFLSGAISKTINMPAESTPQDIEDAYMFAWKRSLKSIAIYRDGSKGSQPVNIQKREKRIRRSLPPECSGPRLKFEISGMDVFVHTGCYEDGSLGEIFIRASKVGSTIQGLLDGVAVAMSLALQHGVPLQTFVEKYRHSRFAPDGWLKLPQTEKNGHYSSILDVIAHWLELRFCEPRDETLEQVSTELCGRCGTQMVQNGTCKKCPGCGETSGCS